MGQQLKRRGHDRAEWDRGYDLGENDARAGRNLVDRRRTEMFISGYESAQCAAARERENHA